MNSHDTATAGTTGQLPNRTSMKTDQLLTITRPRLGQIQAAKRYDMNLISGMYAEDPTFRNCMKKGLERYARP